MIQAGKMISLMSERLIKPTTHRLFYCGVSGTVEDGEPVAGQYHPMIGTGSVGY